MLILPLDLVQQIKAASAQIAQTRSNSVDVCCTAHGFVKDPLGASVPNVFVELLDQNGPVLLTIHAGSGGLYQVSVPKLGQFQLRTHVKSFKEFLRYISGVQVTRTGGTGGASIRGGLANTAKVLIDAVPANDIGEAAEFANISTVAIDRIEVLRGPNSALYDSDALAGVVSLATRRGSTVTPRLDYSADGGNVSFYRQEDNAVFGFATRPRATIGYYLTRPGAGRLFSRTKVNASFAKGINGPCSFQQNKSLLSLLAANPARAPLIAQYNIDQVGP